MKILKILFIILVPALGIVGCQKSDVKPDCPKHTESNSTVNNNSESANTNVGARGVNVSIDGEEEDGSTVVGSGDGDRDGGDRKKKTK